MSDARKALLGKAKELRRLARQAEQAASGGGYDAHRDDMAERSRTRSAAARDIGVIPPIADPERRERCRTSLRLFCDTYNPEAFNLAWSDDQLKSVARIEEAVTLGALYALAEARGNGKTTRCRMAALWAVSYRYCRYVYLIGSTDSKAEDTLQALRTFLRFLPTYAADFPEISYPIQRLDGIAHRAQGQTCNGVPTMIEWTADRIVFPTVRPPSNWPAHWPLRPDGMVPTAGNVISTSGLTGEGIRGSLKTLTTGEQVRPDLVLLDDPQTSESARSRTQNATREQLISADVLGMAGPGQKLSVIMPCTIIAPGDAMDRMTDRSKHPLWRGERSGILKSMPKNMAAWDLYFEVYRQCALKEPPDFTEANDHYLEHRTELDEGAEANWNDRKLPTEVSAIQHAMHLYFRDRRAFMAEYMNQPEPVEPGDVVDDLDSAKLVQRLNRVPRGTVPQECSRLTAFIDCGSNLLHYIVCGWGEQFAGAVVDYGTFPRQNRNYYAAVDARPNMADHWPNYNEDSRIYAGLKELVREVVGRPYPRQGGGEMTVEKCLIDAAKWTKTVTQFCRQSPLAAILLPYRGYGIAAGKPPMANWARREGEIAKHQHWRIRHNTEGGHGRLLLSDVNYWKSFVAAALQAPEAGPCCLQLFGTEASTHQLFADHLTAEYSVRVRPEKGDRRPVDVWSVRPNRPDNHYWDCLVGATVAASILGLKWDSGAAVGDPAPPKQRKPKRDLLAEFYERNPHERPRQDGWRYL